VLACFEPPQVVHAREIALLDAGIKKSKLAPVELAKAKELRDSAEALYKAGKYDQAQQDLHAGLVKIGYSYEVAQPTKGSEPEGPRAIGLVPQSASPSVALEPTGCGGGGKWVPPTE